MSDLKLKPLSVHAIPAALKKAEQYRALNDPEQSESICRDILRASPDHQEALVLLILSLTDLLSTEASHGIQVIREYIGKLESEYLRLYYTGLMHERQSRALLARGAPHLYEAFREAMDWYEKAAQVRPEGVDDAVLRWNSCYRTLTKKQLTSAPVERELPLE